MTEWRFSDPPNVAVIVDRMIVQGEDWIAHVSHDADDGAWQFHGNSLIATEADVILIGLRNATQLDPTIAELGDLPLGWRAWRETRTAKWQRVKM
jgi:hypothetical protein